VTEPAHVDPHGAAREAASRGEWSVAYALLMEAQSKDLLQPHDLPLLGEAAYAAGHLDAAIETWERAHTHHVKSGDAVSAAAAATKVAMHLLMDTLLMAPVRGWISRAERLLEGCDETPVHGWLAVAHTYERLLSGDVAGCQSWAQRAIEIGVRKVPAAAAIGRVAHARALLVQGEVAKGLELLHEAGVAAVSGELDPLSMGIVYCELVCALQGIAHYDLAEEWTEAMERWRPRGAMGSMGGRCRVHRAEILRFRGLSDEAEKEALLACEELRPYLRRELGWPLSELGRIRLLKGDVEGADEAFSAAHGAGWDPEPGPALVHLARGDVNAAAMAIRHALEHPSTVPSKELPPNTELRRVPLLEAAVRIEIAAGDLPRARLAAGELEAVAARFESKALSASATVARARLRFAEGAITDARSDFEIAARLWDEVGAPYETALARQGLGEALRAEGSEERAFLELKAARALFEKVGALNEAERATEDDCTAPRTKTGAPLEAGPPPEMASLAETSPPGDDVFRREGDCWSIAFAGSTVRIRDLKGMHYLARMLTEPGREWHAVDLAQDGAGGVAVHVADPDLATSGNSDSGEVLDAAAKEAYRRRLADIEADIEDARASADLGRLSQASGEREFLVRELSRAVGLGGRDRRIGSTSERARASVTRAIRQAITRIRQHHPALAKHLDHAVHTGTYCSYAPDPRAPVRWAL
jgi:tetratricopeptide (TPR) repeat protein